MKITYILPSRSKACFNFSLLLLLLLGTFTMHISAEELAAQEIPYQSDWLKGHYAGRMAHFKLQPLNKGDIVFIGDSITEQGMNWAIRFNDLRVRNRGISGDMTYGVLARLDEMKANPPRAIFLKIGINDIFNLYYEKDIQDLSSVSRNIEKITRQLDASLPNTKIFVQSLLPDYSDYITVMANSVNKQLQAIENKTFTYLDIHAAFSNEQGVMNPKLTTDGTHLNEAGYQVWQQQLAPIIKTL